MCIYIYTHTFFRTLGTLQIPLSRRQRGPAPTPSTVTVFRAVAAICTQLIHRQRRRRALRRSFMCDIPAVRYGYTVTARARCNRSLWTFIYGAVVHCTHTNVYVRYTSPARSYALYARARAYTTQSHIHRKFEKGRENYARVTPPFPLTRF